MASSGGAEASNVDQLVALTQKLWDYRDGGLELEVDEVLNHSLNFLTLVGKIICDRLLNKNAVKNVIQRVWNPRHGVTVSDMEENVFLFKFNSEEDVKRVLNGGPWTIMGSHLLLKRWYAEATLGDVDFTHSSFWVRCFGVPLNMRNPANCGKIAALLGGLQEIDVREEGATYFRLKVAINIQRPLCPGFPLKMQGSVDRWIDFKYERLPNFCYGCGRMGHEIRACENTGRRDNFFGAWMRAENKVMSPMFTSSEERFQQTRRQGNGKKPLPDILNMQWTYSSSNEVSL